MNRRMTQLLTGALMLAASGSLAAWPSDTAPWVFDLPKGGTNCTVLDPIAFPVRYDVSFGGEIQPVLASICANCHTGLSFGGFNVLESNVRNNLLGANETGTPFSGNPSIFRLRPFRPLESGLFLKLNCEIPPVPYGGRMPPGGGAPSELQALIHDWIASGAIMSSNLGGDRISVGNFESIVRPAPAP